MPNPIDMSKLSALLRGRRESRGLGLREAAAEIQGVTSSTLSRIERGKVPDLDTFVRICSWLGVSTNDFVPNPESGKKPSHRSVPETPEFVAAHLRADRVLSPATVEALSRMIHLAYEHAKAQKRDKRKDR